MTLDEMAVYIAKIPKLESMLLQILEMQEKVLQKKPYLKSAEACKYLQCSNTTLRRLVKMMAVEYNDKGYNSYDLQQVYNKNLNYRYFNRPKDWEDKLKPIHI
ncbi:MAG: hypothetical protein MUC49_15865 [Raineya sp.]|jgi:hypothetical protein|nr:hypothetical protein [Raineya sp.]